MAPIEGIKLGFKLADLAKSQGKKFTNIKLKNNAELNILKNENAYDVYITRKDRCNWIQRQFKIFCKLYGKFND